MAYLKPGGQLVLDAVVVVEAEDDVVSGERALGHEGEGDGVAV